MGGGEEERVEGEEKEKVAGRKSGIGKKRKKEGDREGKRERFTILKSSEFECIFFLYCRCYPALPRVIL